MKEHADLFKRSVGNTILGVTTIDPSLRRSPVRGAVVVGVAVTFGVLVVVTAVVYKNVNAVRGFFSGHKVAI